MLLPTAEWTGTGTGTADFFITSRFLGLPGICCADVPKLTVMDRRTAACVTQTTVIVQSLPVTLQIYGLLQFHLR